jgi:hypothetical protein
VAWICADEPGRRALAAEAVGSVGEDRFSPEHVHQSFERLYAETVAASRARRRFG